METLEMVGLPKKWIRWAWKRAKKVGKSQAFKEAWRKSGRLKKSRSRRVTKTSSRRVRRTARRKKRRGGPSIIRTAMKLIRLAALAGPGIHDAMRGVDGKQKLTFIIESYTGYNLDKGEFRFEWLARGWTPYLGAVAATYGIPKIAGILRKL
jgi:hypothetical protein